MSLVLSRKAHARILNVDPSEALQLAGVHSYICHKDVQGQNICGFPDELEEIIATDKVSEQCSLMVVIHVSKMTLGFTCERLLVLLR